MSKSNFNVFEVLDITREEYYSRVLAWLLNPTGSHRQRGLFLKWFLETCGIPQRTPYESVTLEEQIVSAEDDPRQRIDIALRCEGYLIYIEVKTDNRSIDKLQPFKQYEAGQKQSDSENRQFVYVFLTPDETAPNRVSLPKETRLVTWLKVRDAIQEQVHKLENKGKQPKASAEQTVVLGFLRQFI
jgi:hypothetical protein